MIMADVLKIVFLILGAFLIFSSYWLAAVALFPRVVERARQQYEKHAVKITLLGLVIMIPAIAIGIGFGKAPNPVAKMIGVALVAVPVLLGLIGSTGLCQRVGCGLPSALDEQQPWRRVLRGGIVVALTFLLPVIGWFIVLPWTIVSGCGAAVLALKQARKAAAPTPPVVVEAKATV